jgi:hypothetical protein
VPGVRPKNIKADVGSWHFAQQANQAAASVREEDVGVSHGASSVGDAAGQANLTLEYWSIPGPKHGFAGTLTVSQEGLNPATREARLFADGEQIDTFEVGGETRHDLKAAFGAGMERIKDVEAIKVTLALGDDEFTVFEAKLSGTADAMAAMKKAADAYFVQSGSAEEFARRARQSGGGGGGSGQAGGGCFLTTACCGVIGLPDDCFELATLRRFRDEVMMSSADGRADVARYYAEAPQIVAGIHRCGDESVLLRLYFTHILPSALAARFGLHSLARRLYTGMMRRLSPYLAG